MKNTNANAKHTPGPWRWEINEKSKTLQLCGGDSPFDLTVIDFERWGMGSAVARFRADVRGMNIMHHAKDFAVVVVGREHHADWFKGLNHPDANLIAASPDLAAGLEHMQHCRSCAEGSWEDCDGGRAALAALAQARGER